MMQSGLRRPRGEVLGGNVEVLVGLMSSMTFVRSHEAPSRRHELAAAPAEPDDVDRRGRRDVVPGPEVVRRTDHAQEGVDLGPGVALGESTAHDALFSG